MFFGELRTKVIHIDIQNDSVKIRRYLGLALQKHITLVIKQVLKPQFYHQG